LNFKRAEQQMKLFHTTSSRPKKCDFGFPPRERRNHPSKSDQKVSRKKKVNQKLKIYRLAEVL
jgi:hypothetical protein